VRGAVGGFSACRAGAAVVSKKSARDPSLSNALADSMPRMLVDHKSLLKRLTKNCVAALEAGATQAVQARHYEITIEHFLLALLDDATTISTRRSSARRSSGV
jgi:hypothetical protein